MAISKKVYPRIKLWLENDGEVVFGEGRLRLLAEIEKQGSIHKAAKELSMSYRAAWGKIKASEKRLGKELLVIRKGGAQGGGASLTPYAKSLVEKYIKFKQKVLNSSEKNFEKIFYKARK